MYSALGGQWLDKALYKCSPFTFNTSFSRKRFGLATVEPVRMTGFSTITKPQRGNEKGYEDRYAHKPQSQNNETKTLSIIVRLFA